MRKDTRPGMTVKMVLLGVALVAIILNLSGCGSQVVVLPKNQNEVPRITPADLKAQIDRGEDILIVDARSASEFESRHIADAKSVPLAEVASRLDEFRRDQVIVFY